MKDMYFVSMLDIEFSRGLQKDIFDFVMNIK